MKKVVIVRGLPGSGKTHFALSLIGEHLGKGPANPATLADLSLYATRVAYCSADLYFTSYAPCSHCRGRGVLTERNLNGPTDEFPCGVCGGSKFGDATYKWDSSKLENAHHDCLVQFLRALRTGVPYVVVDNTNVHRADFEIYESAAYGAGYWPSVVLPPDQPEDSQRLSVQHIRTFFVRNQHNVPLATIARMAAEWED